MDRQQHGNDIKEARKRSACNILYANHHCGKRQDWSRAWDSTHAGQASSALTTVCHKQDARRIPNGHVISLIKL